MVERYSWLLVAHICLRQHFVGPKKRSLEDNNFFNLPACHFC